MGGPDEAGAGAAQSRDGRHSGLRRLGNGAGGRRGADLMSVSERLSAGPDDQLLSAEEVAEMIGMTKSYVYDLSRRGSDTDNHLRAAAALPASSGGQMAGAT